MKLFKRTLSILLSFVLIISVFSIVPFTVQAMTANIWYYDRYWFNSVQKVLTEK